MQLWLSSSFFVPSLPLPFLFRFLPFHLLSLRIPFPLPLLTLPFPRFSSRLPFPSLPFQFPQLPQFFRNCKRLDVRDQRPMKLRHVQSIAIRCPLR